jgi:hypothetical protein
MSCSTSSHYWMVSTTDIKMYLRHPLHAHNQWILPTAVTLSQVQRSAQTSCSKLIPFFRIQLQLNLSSLPVSSVLASKRYHMWHLWFPHNLFICFMAQDGQYCRPLNSNFMGVQTGELATVMSWRTRRLKLQAVTALCFIYTDTMEDSTDILIVTAPSNVREAKNSPFV